MQKDPAAISLLIYRHLEGILSKEEQQLLDDWCKEEESNQRLFARMTDNQHLHQGVSRQFMIHDSFDKVYAKILHEINPPPIYFFKKYWFRYAAALILLCGIGAYLFNIHYFNKEQKVAIQPNSASQPDVPAGKDGAILTLADGSQLVLDSLGNGVVGNQQGTTVLLQNGRLTYTPQQLNKNVVAYNTLTTPKGHQFQLVLPDGSKVYLNAASSLTYPTAFNGKERLVTITGEAFFEVAEDKNKPFMVAANQTKVQVLGTSFNINAYENETAVKTTLLNGSVKVSNNMATSLLKPGEQAQLFKNDINIVKNADLQEAFAWKDGSFRFNNTPLEAIMRQLERWYNIETIYRTNTDKSSETFSGVISRTNNLSEVLKMLELTKVVKFTLNGNKVTVE